LNGVDRATTLTFLEGKDYSEQKKVNITFNNGTDAHTIINRVASEANIPLSEIKLKNNKIYGSGYTDDGQGIMVLQEI
ncbi:phage protein, partial [Enterococcus faecalis]